MPDERDQRFYDLVYDEWRRGHNPDALSQDRFDAYLSDGYAPDEISLGMMCPHKPQPEETDATPQD